MYFTYSATSTPSEQVPFHPTVYKIFASPHSIQNIRQYSDGQKGQINDTLYRFPFIMRKKNFFFGARIQSGIFKYMNKTPPPSKSLAKFRNFKLVPKVNLCYRKFFCQIGQTQKVWPILRRSFFIAFLTQEVLGDTTKVPPTTPPLLLYRF